MIPHNLVSVRPISNVSPSAATPPHGLIFSELHCIALHWIAHLCWIVLHSLTLQRIGFEGWGLIISKSRLVTAGVRFPIPGYKHCFLRQKDQKYILNTNNGHQNQNLCSLSQGQFCNIYVLIFIWFDIDPHTLPCYPLHQKQDDAFSEARGCKHWFWSERDIWDLQQQRWVRWGFRKSRPWPRAHLGAGGDL